MINAYAPLLAKTNQLLVTQVLTVLLLIAFYKCGGHSIKQEVAVGRNKQHITGQDVADNHTLSLHFFPDAMLDLKQGHLGYVYANVSYRGDVGATLPVLSVKSHDEEIAKLKSVIMPSDNQSFYTVVLEGVFLGRTSLEISHWDQSDNTSVNHNLLESSIDFVPMSSHQYNMQSASAIKQVTDQLYPNVQSIYNYKVAVIREEGWIDQLFIGSVSLVVLITNMGMGCKIDLDVVLEVLKKPIAPFIGFTCQFLIMPLVAYSLVILFDIPGGQALGFYATGCSPGGGASNMYTYILGGDVSLSVTMTLVSTAASFAMIPLWLYTLGTHFIDDKTNISIPFENILVSLAGIIVPVGFGIIIQKKRPAWAKSLRKCLKPLFIFLIIFLFTFGMWVNSYLFGLFTVNMVLASSLLPYTGFLLAGGAALVLRQPMHRVITICIETGIQNTGIPILLMKFSLPQPEADMSVIAPVMIAFFTPFPLWIAIAIKELQKKCSLQKSDDTEEGEDDDDMAEAGLNNSTENHVHTSKDIKDLEEEKKFTKVISLSDSDEDVNVFDLSPVTSDVTDIGSQSDSNLDISVSQHHSCSKKRTSQF